MHMLGKLELGKFPLLGSPLLGGVLSEGILVMDGLDGDRQGLRGKQFGGNLRPGLVQFAAFPRFIDWRRSQFPRFIPHLLIPPFSAASVLLFEMSVGVSWTAVKVRHTLGH